MRAIRVQAFGGPEVLKLETVADLTPAANQILIRVHAIGVNPVDTYIRAGSYPMKPALPYTPGTDAAGTVESVGAGVTSVKVGQRVYIFRSVSGAYAERVLCEPTQVFPLPEKISFAQGAAVGVPYSTAYFGLFYRGRAMPAESVLIHGASGSVGMAAVQLAREHGLTVIGTAGTPQGLEIIKREGAHHAFDHHSAGYLDDIVRLTNGAGVPLVLEMASHINLGKVLPIIASRGRVIVIGSRGPVQIDPRSIMSRNADIRAMSINTLTPAEIVGIHSAVGAGLELGVLKPVISKEFPLAEAARAHEAVLAAGANGKIVLIP